MREHPGRRLMAVAAVIASGGLVLSACSSSSPSSTKAATTSPGSNALHAMLPASVKASGVVKLATDAEYPPCETLNASGQMVGYEPDLWNAMAAKLGVRIQASSILFDSLIPGVQSGRYDMAMECISDNLDREKQVIFVDNAYATGAVYTLASNKTITTDPLSLCGLKTATQQGLDLATQLETTINPHCTKNGKPVVQIARFPTANAALLALYSGRVDFVLNDYAAANAMMAAAPKPLRYVTNSLLQKYYNGMIFNKNNAQLANAFLAALKAIIADGTYDKIMKKWALPALELNNPGINLAQSDPIPTPAP